MALPAPGNSISASQINVEATRSASANAPLSGTSSTPQAGSLVKIYEDSGVNQTAPHSYSEFYGISYDVGVIENVIKWLGTWPPSGTPTNYYFPASIGNAGNLALGDVLYTDGALTTTLGAGSYYQNNTVNNVRHYCYVINPCGDTYIQINSSGEIIELYCEFCP